MCKQRSVLPVVIHIVPADEVGQGECFVRAVMAGAALLGGFGVHHLAGQLPELACVVRSSPQLVAKATQGMEFPFPIICDAPGVLYSYLGVEQARGLLSWSFSAQRIYKNARDAGYKYDRNAPQILPMTLIVGHLGKILFTHSGRSQTDLPEDCTAIRELAQRE